MGNRRRVKHTTKAPRTTRRSASSEQETSRLHAHLQQLEQTLAALEADPELQADEKATLRRCYQERLELLRLQLTLLPEAKTAAFAQSLLQAESSEGGKLRAIRSVQRLARGRALGGGNRDSQCVHEGALEEQADRLQRARIDKASQELREVQARLAAVRKRITALKAGEKKRAATIRQVMKIRDARKRTKREQEERAASQVSPPQLPPSESPVEAPPVSPPPSDPPAALVELPALGESPFPEQQFRHYPDSREVWLAGQRYSVSEQGNEIVAILWTGWQSDTPDMFGKDILKKIGSTSADARLRDAFGKSSPLWRKLIVHSPDARPGTYRLNLRKA
ncbi:MAG TPA: hypothetical protein VFL79_22410 [Terriglobia bacterium]|nr:hypothetical protein [Terriglobia bacterium]